MASVRILLVEDESIVAMDMERRLTALGYQVVEHVLTGEDAVAKAEEERPDLILMDIHLKGEMDGIEAAERIKSSLGTPIIYITAYSDETTLSRAKVTEPFGYILKPFQEREIYSTIEMALYKYKIEQELKSAKIRAEEGSRAKSEFLANVSHELRTPLNSILGMTRLAMNTEDRDEQREYLHIVENSGKSLLTLIDSLLTFSKMEAGKVILNNHDFYLDEIVENSLNKVWTQVQEKDLFLYVDIDENSFIQLHGDQEKLEQILLNLVSNAIKFTDSGWVYLRFTTESSTESSNKGGIIFLNGTVRDTGCGIPEEEKKYVFDAFHQVDSTSTRQYSGAGLGLSIVHDLVKLLGGSIEFSTRLGEGTEFSFHIQLEKGSASSERDIDSPRFDSAPPVFYLSTDSTFCDIRCRQLQAWGLKVITGKSGGESTVKPGSLFIVADRVGESHRIGTRLEAEGVPAERILYLVRDSRDTLQEHGTSNYLYSPIHRGKLIRMLQGLFEGAAKKKEWKNMPSTIKLQDITVSHDEEMVMELHEQIAELRNTEVDSLTPEGCTQFEQRVQHTREFAQKVEDDKTAALLFKLILAVRTHDKNRIKKMLDDSAFSI